MEILDEYFALENIRDNFLGDFFSPTTMNFDVEFNTSCSSNSSYMTKNSASPGSPYCNDFPSDSFNLLQFEPNSSDSSLESANLVQNQSKFLRLESQQSISVDFLKEESKCFEFDIPSNSFNLLHFGPNSSDLSFKSANLVQNQSNFSKFESQQSISSKCFEFDFPSDSLNLLESGLNSSDSSLESANLVQKQSNFSKFESQQSISSKCFEFDFPPDSLNLLRFGPNPSNSSSESANLVQNQSNFSKFESQQPISSKCFEFDFPSDSLNLLQSGPKSSDLSFESVNLVQNQSNFSISSVESVDFLKEKRKHFEFAPKPKIIIDLTSPKPRKPESQSSISRSESIDFEQTESKCFEFEAESQVIIDLTSPKPRKPESQLSISRSESIDFEQTKSKCFEFEAEPQVIIDLTSPKHPQIASSKSSNLHERKPPSLKIDLSAVHGGVKRRREVEEGGGEEAAVKKFEKSVEEWPLTPSRWNSFWGQNSNGMGNIPPLSPLSPHPPLGCAQLMVV